MPPDPASSRVVRESLSKRKGFCGENAAAPKSPKELNVLISLRGGGSQKGMLPAACIRFTRTEANQVSTRKTEQKEAVEPPSV
jgi:hypothetical protein